jgi:hypothetical protein
MSTVTLLARIYNSPQLKLVEKFLQSSLEGLNVKIENCEATSRGWVQTAISGEDEKIALNYLANEIGLCPKRLESVEKFSTIKGCLTVLDKNKGKVSVDIGVFSPDIVDAMIPLHHLQAQLADGRKIALKTFIELFGFSKNLPLTVKILDIDEGDNYIEATLAEEQLAQYRNWTKSMLDRLIVLRASRDEIAFALKKAECNRDVVNIEPLGLFEHAVVCKLGTDAAGLMPKIGRSLQQATFNVFNPRKILEFLGDDSNLLSVE